MDENSRDPLKDFEKRWSLWALRPTQTSPDEAAQRLLDRLPDRIAERRLATSWRVLLPAAALVILTIGAGILWRSYPPPPTASRPSHSSIALDESTALIWLDPETPLYLTLTEPEAKRGERQ